MAYEEKKPLHLFSCGILSFYFLESARTTEKETTSRLDYAILGGANPAN